MLRPHGGSTATALPAARGTEHECHGAAEVLARSSRWRAPDGSAPHGSAPRTRRGRGSGVVPRRELGGRDTPRESSVEKTNAASGRPYTMSVGLDPIPALVSTIAQK